MVKPGEKLKVTGSELDYPSLLRDLLVRIPSVVVESVHAGKTSADLLVALKVGGKAWTLVAEVKRLGQPQEIRGAVAQLQQYLSGIPGRSKYPIVLAPYLSPESARLCEDAGVGYADLSGNVKLSFGPVYIETQGKQNTFKRRKEGKSLFSPKNQRALRYLLQGPLQSWKISQLAKTAEISLGWASALKQQLVAREWAQDHLGGVRVTRPDAILDAWAEADDWGKRTEVREYSSLEFELEKLAEKLRDAGEKKSIAAPAFTQWFAGWLRQPYTLSPIITAYVEEWPDERVLEILLGARRVSQAGRLWLVRPHDKGVFNPVQKIKGFPLVSDVQIYLDLLRAGQRGDEQAAELRKRHDFSGGWT